MNDNAESVQLSFLPGAEKTREPARRGRTQEEREALMEIRKLAPKAVRELEKLLDNEKASHAAKIQAIDIILNRTYGKPEAALKVETAQQSVEASAAKIRTLVAEIREEEGLIS